MQQTQSVIVYRSQSEKLIDDAVMSGDMVPIFGALISGVIVFVILFSLMKKIETKLWPIRHTTKLYSILHRVFFYYIPPTLSSGLFGVLTVYLVGKYLWI